MARSIALYIPKWNIEELNGYKPQTTFWQDFWIAAQFGSNAVENTYDRAFAEWMDDYIYMTELSLVLNHLGWMHHKTNPKLAQVFFELWEQLIDWCHDNLKGEELEHFLSITD